MAVCRSEDRIIFSFAGMDEMDEVNGAGTIAMDGESLIFTLMYHQGDDYIFGCERAAPAAGETKSKRG